VLATKTISLSFMSRLMGIQGVRPLIVPIMTPKKY
jgi:hypothetical protein